MALTARHVFDKKQFPEFTEANNAKSYTGDGDSTVPILRIRTIEGKGTPQVEEHVLFLGKLTPNVDIIIGRADTNQAAPPNKIDIMHFEERYISRKVASVFYNPDADQVKFTLEYTAQSPNKFPMWEHGNVKINTDVEEKDRKDAYKDPTQPNKYVVTMNRNEAHAVHVIVTEDFYYRFFFKWPLQRCVTQGYPGRIIEGPKTMDIDATQEYNGGAGATGGAGSAGDAGSAGGAGATGGAEGADEILEDDLPEEHSFPDFVNILDENNIPYNNINLNGTDKEVKQFKLPKGRTVSSSVYFAVNPDAQKFVSNLIQNTDNYIKTEPKKKGFVVAKALRVLWQQVIDKRPNFKTTFMTASTQLNKQNKEAKEALALLAAKEAKDAKKARKAMRAMKAKKA